MLRKLKHFFVGRPLTTAQLPEQRLSKVAALAVLSSDALSSSAYATEEMLLALIAAGAISLTLSIPAGILIVILLWIVVTSYSQTLYAYPSGGGAYTVAKENLGVLAALVAGAALLIDYVLTVSVSVAAGIAAVTSAVPSLYSHRVALCLVAILLILLANLRGVRESARIFQVPVYFFIVSAYVLVVGSLIGYLVGAPSARSPEVVSQVFEPLSALLLLRAFASGCTALTGVEAIANGVRVFRPPVSRNATITLYIMAIILGTLFLGITVSAHLYGLSPREGETILSQLGRHTFGTGPVYYAFQASTTGILILAANTSFAGFPRLASIMAQDRYLPRQLANLGDRLVFSNGILVLGTASGALLVVFGGDVHRLIPVYMVGVFIAFTLSQAAMVEHWKKIGGPGAGWRVTLNGFGAGMTALALIVVASVKFTHGAWIVLAAIPLMVWGFVNIREHYAVLARQLSLADFDRPRELKHTVVIPVAGINRVVLGAVEYARSISKDVIAVTVNQEGQNREEVLRKWEEKVEDVPLVVLNSPYRSVLNPLLRFIEEVEHFRDDDVVTVLLPEFVSARWWHHLLHNQTSLLLKGALLFKPKIVVTSVPYHLRK